MSDDAARETTAPLQFDQVELPAGGASKLCGLCGTSIADTYFEAGGRVLCPACADKVSGNTAGFGAFPRAALFGAGAAIIGTIVWAIIMKVTGMELGIVAVGVGLLVGRAVQHGSRGRGGWKYQLLAMFLSYASICSSYVPMVIKGISENSEQAAKKEAEAATAGAAGATADAKPADVDQKAAKPNAPLTVVAFLIAVAAIFAIAFAAPFLAGFENIMGILIIAVALYEAWKLNRKIVVAGPFRMAAEPAAPVAAAGAP